MLDADDTLETEFGRDAGEVGDRHVIAEGILYMAQATRRGFDLEDWPR